MEDNKSRSGTVRAFIAVDIAPDVLRRVDELSHKLKRTDCGVKWVRPESMHLTLRFLGNITMDQVEAAAKAVEDTAKVFKPVLVEVKGWGTFPPEKRPRVVWLGVKKGARQLSEIFEELELRLADRGFGPADKAFSPHLTLGRVKSGKGLNRALRVMQSEADKSFGLYRADRIILFRSELSPAGAKYSVLSESALSGNREED